MCPTLEIIQRCLKAKNCDLEDLFKEEKGGTELFTD